MSPPSLLFMGRKAEEPETIFRWPFPSMTETDLMPNPVAVDSERAEGKSKKGEGFMGTEIRTLPEPNPQSAARLTCLTPSQNRVAPLKQHPQLQASIRSI